MHLSQILCDNPCIIEKSLLFVQFWAARGFCQRVLNSRICQHCDVKTSTVTPPFYSFLIIFLTCYISVPSFIYNLCQVLLLRNHLKECVKEMVIVYLILITPLITSLCHFLLTVSEFGVLLLIPNTLEIDRLLRRAFRFGYIQHESSIQQVIKTGMRGSGKVLWVLPRIPCRIFSPT